jgi:hypothetical protein
MCGDILNFWGVRHDKLVIFPIHVICFYATNKGKKTKRITRKKRVPPEYHIEAQYDKKKLRFVFRVEQRHSLMGQK